MQYFRKIRKIYLTVCALFLCLINYQTAYADSEKYDLYVGGFPAGFVLNTNSVEVVGLCEVLTENGMQSPAKDVGIKCGDVIESINGIKLEGVKSVAKILNVDAKEYLLRFNRSGEFFEDKIVPVIEKQSGEKKLGMLIKDSISGVGTVTYVDRNNNKFASLGHPVNYNNGKVIDIYDGKIYKSLIYDVKKGMRGAPGELKGVIENGEELGEVKSNCISGIYGYCNDLDYSNLIKAEKAEKTDVKIGDAVIYTTINGVSPEKYDVSIVKYDFNDKNNRNFVVKIDDKRLIEKTGGIVQGMSGSPIVQNGKLIGAITHVFVNDPTRGYGIFIDNMLNSY